jgi:hypothetical protein
VCVAQDTSASPPVTNDVSQQGVAGRMLMLLEQRAKLEQVIATGEGRIEELLRQLEWKNLEIAAMVRIDKLKDEKIALLESKEAIYQKIDEGKDKLHEQELKAAKPTFAENAGKFAIGGISGAALLGLLLLFL